MHALLSNLKKGSLVGLAIAGCMVASTGVASANSVTLSQSGGVGSSTYSVSTSFTVTVFANLGPDGGGQVAIGVDLFYDATKLTATGCAETPGQIVGGFSYAPFFTPNCGPGGNGGLTTPGVVNFLGQEVVPFTAAGATSGTLSLGTVTFHATDPGSSVVTSSFGCCFGFLGDDNVNRTTGIPLGTASVTVIPEPTTLVLLGLGCLGLGLNGRRLRRR